MDTLQLNRINELAREYLRLGIAKNTSDAVEKARFQLAFEKERVEPAESPYESLFSDKRSPSTRSADEPERSEEPEPQRGASLSPLDVRKDRYTEMRARIEELETGTERRGREQQGRIAELEQALAEQRARLEPIERTMQQLRDEVARLGAAQASRPAGTEEQAAHEASGAVAAEGPISSSIEQTIKGRKISSADVAVDKIFYFGNR